MNNNEPISSFSDAIKAKQPILFLRWTDDPMSDKKRGFSGHMQAWYRTKEEALKDYEEQKARGHISLEPKYDSTSGFWNSDPEAGISGYGFYDEKTFERAKREIKEISWFHKDDKGQDLGLFQGTLLAEEGFDGEELFENIEFIAWIEGNESFEEIKNMANKKNINEVRNIIRKELLERFGFNNNKTYSPPMDVKSTAQRALSSAAPTQNGGNEGSGKRKAQELANGTIQSHAQMKRLKAFFDGNEPGSPEWELHGGDAAKRWVDSALAGTHDDNMRTKENMRRTAGTGYGGNEGMGSMDANMMSTTNSRNHSAWTRVKNRNQNKSIKEAMVDKDGNLLGFQSDEEEAREFHIQWDMWLENMKGEEVQGFTLGHDGWEAIWEGEDDDYKIRVSLFPEPDFENVIMLFLYKDETLIHYHDEVAPRELMETPYPGEVWDFYMEKLNAFITEAKRLGKFID